MKKSHVFGIVIIAIAIAVIISTAGEASTYVSFREAFSMAEQQKTTSIHVVGTLKKDESGQILGMHYAPQLDPNYFEFTMVDQNGEEQKVVYLNPKPQDLERSEQIVIIGSVRKNTFVADKILMKCPSKYQDNEFREV
jgi:cytochrome c-type biogenesis protein CcmE